MCLLSRIEIALFLLLVFAPISKTITSLFVAAKQTLTNSKKHAICVNYPVGNVRVYCSQEENVRS